MKKLHNVLSISAISLFSFLFAKDSHAIISVQINEGLSTGQMTWNFSGDFLVTSRFSERRVGSFIEEDFILDGGSANVDANAFFENVDTGEKVSIEQVVLDNNFIENDELELILSDNLSGRVGERIEASGFIEVEIDISQLSPGTYVPSFSEPSAFEGNLEFVNESASVPFEFSPTSGFVVLGSVFGISHLLKRCKARFF